MTPKRLNMVTSPGIKLGHELNHLVNQCCYSRQHLQVMINDSIDHSSYNSIKNTKFEPPTNQYCLWLMCRNRERYHLKILFLKAEGPAPEYCGPGDSSRDLLGMVTSRDPKSKAIGDLQCSGIKRSRLESPGILNNLSFICYFNWKCKIATQMHI